MKMLVSILLFLIFIFLVACSGGRRPTQVTGDIEVRQYIITPPEGYWYFPGKSEGNMPDSATLFTFFKDKRDAMAVVYEGGRFFLNLYVKESDYIDIDAYYADNQRFGVHYSLLPKNIDALLMTDGWSCKEILSGFYGIECVYLEDTIISVALIGDDEQYVRNQSYLIKDMISSVRKKKGERGKGRNTIEYNEIRQT